jgi:hypothetical protein
MNETGTAAANWGARGDTIVRVEQGPRWLADLLYNPPLWAQRALPLLVGVVGVVALLALWRVGLPEDVWPEIAENLAIAGCVALTTTLLTHLPGGFLLDVGVGLVVGYSVAVIGVRRVVVPRVWPNQV